MLLCMDYIVASSDVRLTLPARKEGIVPGLANLRLLRYAGLRIARQAIQHGLELPCDSAEGRLICDEIMAADDMDRATRSACEAIMSCGRAGYIANRRALRAGFEPLDAFCQYCAGYAREQAHCHFSAELISNLENHWRAQERSFH
jgi:thioesterase DpgC